MSSSPSTIWATSDLHLDYVENWRWWADLPQGPYVNDTLLIAGDVHSDLEHCLLFFEGLLPKFKRLFFVPGNHDLWFVEGETGTSFEKFERLLNRLDAIGVHTQPLIGEVVTIVPLFSWYDYSFGEPTTTLRRAWQDFKNCRWDRPVPEVAQYFSKRNPMPPAKSSQTVITFSHCATRLDLFPQRPYKILSLLLPVLGSTALDEQLRTWGSHYHVYGHHHVNRSITLEDVHYCNNAFGYPHEAHLCRKALLPIYRAEEGLIYHEQFPPLTL